MPDKKANAEKVDVKIRAGWLVLDVAGDCDVSYPIWGEDSDKMIDRFAADLKKALNGDRLSTLT